jgi:hypothetical protein
MATKDQINAVVDAVRADAKQLVDDLVPAFFRGSAEAQITIDRVLKIARDAIAAYERHAQSAGVAGPGVGSKVPPGAQA